MNHPKSLTLEITSGPGEYVRYTALPGNELVVGRDQNSNCAVIDPRLSRKHFLITYCDQNWKIRDLKSANGTYVNNERIHDRFLSDGDSIKAGDSTFQVRLD